ncbi:hypothetical protein FB45DRAFT_1002151 [Roridomyces roridus]|uniref:Uncharacterized protein n=1 Tax=Roridomyces roridus TaxID=1738132 RepID=A0AAD7BYZ1_9AGAR|nr:hypothetical protein FB45DRAFT_1002151 [Roridomyces roridus]
MPLFGSHKNDSNKLEKRERAAYNDAQNDLPPTHGHGHGHHTAPGTMQPGMQPGMVDNTTMGGGRNHHRADPIPAGTDAMADPRYGGGAGMAGVGAGAGAGAGLGPGGAAIPPASHIHDPQQTRGGGAMAGKIEHAVGSLVGSNALKAKGLQKEQEAQALKVQSSELAEAERLEREAALRRERAVAHGAHPENRVGGGGGAPYM